MSPAPAYHRFLYEDHEATKEIPYAHSCWWVLVFDAIGQVSWTWNCLLEEKAAIASRVGAKTDAEGYEIGGEA